MILRKADIGGAFRTKWSYHAPKKWSEIYSNLKRTSTVTSEPKSEHKAEDVGKVKADIESSKIKQLIKNLGKD